MYIDIQEKLNRIEERINHPDFMKMDGAANEVGYYIFDYDPQYELQVRATVQDLVKRYTGKHMSFTIKEFDLFEVLLALLKEKGYLERSIKFEEDRGFGYMQEAVTRMLRVGRDNLIVKHIKKTLRKIAWYF